MDSLFKSFCQVTDLSVLSYVPFSCSSQACYTTTVMLHCKRSFHTAVSCAIFKRSFQSTKILSSRGNWKSIRTSSYTCPLLSFWLSTAFFHSVMKMEGRWNCSRTYALPQLGKRSSSIHGSTTLDIFLKHCYDAEYLAELIIINFLHSSGVLKNNLPQRGVKGLCIQAVCKPKEL